MALSWSCHGGEYYFSFNLLCTLPMLCIGRLPKVWHTSRYLIIIDLVAMEKAYDIVRPETPHDSRLKTPMSMYAENLRDLFPQNSLLQIYS